MADHSCTKDCYNSSGIRKCTGNASYYFSDAHHVFDVYNTCINCRHSKADIQRIESTVCQRHNAPLPEPVVKEDNTLCLLMSGICEANDTLATYRNALKRQKEDEKVARQALETRQKMVREYEDKITNITSAITDSKRKLLEGLLKERDQMTLVITSTEEIGRIE
jgi:hypothetical protein